MTTAACEQHHQIALCRLPNSIGRAVGERRVRISRMGGWPKKRLYSRLNWLALSYPPKNRTGGVQTIHEHAFPRCLQPKLLLILKRTHRCQRPEMVVQCRDAHARDFCKIFHS